MAALIRDKGGTEQDFFFSSDGENKELETLFVHVSMCLIIHVFTAISLSIYFLYSAVRSSFFKSFAVGNFN